MLWCHQMLRCANKTSFFIPLAWKAVGGFCDSAFLLCVCVCVYKVTFLCVCVCVCIPVWLGFRYSGLLWNVEVRWQPNLGQRCNRGSSYVNEVKHHAPRSRVIWGQVRWKMLVFVIWVSFEIDLFKSNWSHYYALRIFRPISLYTN